MSRDSGTPDEEIWYLPAGDDHDCALFVRERGQGPMVVVLHGGPGHSHDLLVGAFDRFESEFRFVYYDQRGALYSPCDRAKISLAANVQDLEKLRKELQIEKLTVVAYSAGALLAMSYAETFPGNLGNAILIGSPPFRYPRAGEEALGEPVVHTPEFDDLIQSNFRHQLSVEGLLEGFDGGSLRAKDLNKAGRISFAANFLHDVSKWQELRGGGIFHSEEAEEATANTIPQPWDYSEPLRRVSASVTAINGTSDYRINRRLWHRIKGEVPQLRYIEIQDAGHALWIDQPEAFGGELELALHRGR